MDSKELASLVQQTREGNVDAFAEIYNEVSKSLYYYALRMTKNEHDARDVVQDTMIEVYKHLGELRNPGALKAYINSVAYRHCINFLNKQKRTQTDDIDEMLDVTDDDDEFIPQSYTETQEKRDYIIKLVDELSDAQKTVILLYYYRQLSSKEIADILGIEDGAVRARLNRARATLKKKIEKDQIYSPAKGGHMLLLMPVLTQILNIEASTLLATGACMAIWESVGGTLGLSAAGRPPLMAAESMLALRGAVSGVMAALAGVLVIMAITSAMSLASYNGSISAPASAEPSIEELSYTAPRLPDSVKIEEPSCGLDAAEAGRCRSSDFTRDSLLHRQSIFFRKRA